MSEPIDPDKLFAFSEACRHIPGVCGGRLSLRSLHRWRRAGRFRAVCRPAGGRRYWFLPGSELLRLVEMRDDPAAVPAPAPRTRGPKRRQRDIEAAKARLRELDMRI